MLYSSVSFERSITCVSTHQTDKQRPSRQPPESYHSGSQRHSDLLRRFVTELLVYAAIIEKWERESRLIAHIAGNPAILPSSPVTPGVNLPLRFPRPEVPALDRLLRRGCLRGAFFAWRVRRYLSFEQQAIPCPLRLGRTSVVVAALGFLVVFGVWR